MANLQLLKIARDIGLESPSAGKAQADGLSQPLNITANKASQYLRWYMATDAAALGAGFLCGWMLAVAVMFPHLTALPMYNSQRFGEFALVAAGVVAWFQCTNHYRMRMPFWLEVKKVVCALGFALMADGFMQFVTRQEPSRLWLMAGWGMAALCIIVFRIMLRNMLMKTGKFYISTLLVGNGATAKHARAALRSEPGVGYDITVQIKNLPLAFLQEGRSWKKLCNAYGVHHVIIALDGAELAAAEQPIAQLMREAIPFSVAPPLHHLPVMGMAPQYFFNHDTMLLTHANGLQQPVSRFVKRMLDITLSSMILLLCTPFMLALAVEIKRDGGPVFFSHARLGRGGKAFHCRKFRSMVTDSDEALQCHLKENPAAQLEWDACHKLQKDPRVTRIGAFLRASSLDELPQLLNVLRGDMSLVGPRPIVAAEVANYESDIAHYYRVRPGMTGLWQVSGRSDVTYAQRVQIDSWYVRNWSLWHDFIIACKTLPAVYKRRGAY